MVTTRYRLPRLLRGLALSLLLLVPWSAAHSYGIRGTVRDAVTGIPLGDVDLDLFDSDFKSVTGFGDDGGVKFDDHTASDGTYNLDPLPVGEYYLRVDPTAAQGYVGQYYPDAFLSSDAAPIQVFGPEPVTVDFYLHPGGMISGRMVDSITGAPVADVDIDLYAWDQSFVSTINAKSDANGDYTIGPLPTGDFYLEADTHIDAMYVHQFYGGAATLEESQSVHNPGQNGITNVDFHLIQGGHIAGLVQDAVTFVALEGVDMDILDANQQVVSTVNGKSDASGFYRLGTLPPGQYYVRADMKAYDPYIDTWSGNVASIEEATMLNVTAGQVSSSVIKVIPGGWITGSVRWSAGGPMPGVDMDLYTASGEFLSTINAVTDASGHYTLGPLPVEEFIVRADPRGNYLVRPMYTGGGDTIEEATLVAVVAGASTGNTDFVYASAADLEQEPEGHQLVGAEPNPFNPRTTISFRLAERQPVRLSIHDVRGRLVALLADGTMPAGTHRVVWDGLTSQGVPSATGVHFMQLQTPDRIETRKLILLK